MSSPTTVIVGAGIIGLHLAVAFRKKGHEVFVLEKEPCLAHHTSGRNSGVIHAGLFSPAESLKQKFCLEGNPLTYEWVKKLAVPHRACGKWVLSTGGPAALEACWEKCKSLPMPSPRFTLLAQLREEEPALKAAEALFIPSTGILDAATYVKKMALYVESLGVELVLSCKLERADGNRLETSRGPFDFDLAVNSAGLHADEVAERTGLPSYSIRPCRGDYFTLPHVPLTRPVYHIPDPAQPGLGIHFTPTLDGPLLVGPNAFFIGEKEDYRFASGDSSYLEAVRTDLHIPPSSSLTPAYSGNRPKLFRHGTAVNDFVIVKQKAWIHLLGIESPGLTAAPAIAAHVGRMVL